MTTKIFFLAASCGLLVANLMASTQLLAEQRPQIEPQTRLSLQRIYQSDDFKLDSPKLQWDEQLDVLWKRTKDEQGYFELRRVDPETLDESVVVRAQDLWLTEASESEQKETQESGPPKPVSIASIQWSSNHEHLLAFHHTRRVWRTNSRGDYRLLNLSTGDSRPLGGELAGDSKLMFAEFSPDARVVAFVHDQDLYVEDVNTGERTVVGGSDDENQIFGTFDWVYEEELGLRKGFQFSDDGAFVAFWHLDQTGVPRHTLIDNTAERYPQTKTFAYPKVGNQNSAARIGVWNSATEQTVWMKIPGDPRNYYLAAMDWVPGRHQLIVQQLNRAQTINQLWWVDATTGDCQPLITEESAGWNDPQKLHWLSPLVANETEVAKRFLWLTERTGWRQVEQVTIPSTLSADRPAQRELITNGDYDVLEIKGVDAGTDPLVYFSAAPLHPTQTALYVTPLQRPATKNSLPQQVSTQSRGVVDDSLSPSGRYSLQKWSAFGIPPVHQLLKLQQGSIVGQRVLEDNAKVVSALAELSPIDEQFVRLPIGKGVELDAWLMMPEPDETSGDRIPLLVYVYGEPAGQTVQDRYFGSGYLWHRYMTELGFAVASIDNRGTRSPRGCEFRHSIKHKIGIMPPADQAAAIRKLLGQFASRLDPKRVAVWGWSGGGSTTLHCLFRYPKLFAAGISIAPVPDQLDYDTIYQERYMGLLDEHRDAYTEGSPITHVQGLQDPLLIIHGSGDDNVHIASTERLVNKLISEEKSFQWMVYPGRTHAISEGDKTTIHLRRLMTDFLKRNLIEPE